MKKLLCFLILWGSLGVTAGYGQDQYANDQMIKFVPTSPNAASLGIFGNIPVGHYTGIPDISVPLYEIQSGDLKLPVKLAYHASGIKVSQEASSVGLGWALMAGGCITREIRHLNDFALNGYHSHELLSNYDDGVIEGLEAGFEYIQYARGYQDSEPDVFNFNFGPYSGQFFFQYGAKNPTIMNAKEYLNISYSVGLRDITHWIVYDAYGNKYTFSDTETTHLWGNTFDYQLDINNITRSSDLTRINQNCPVTEDPPIQAWYLSSIESPRGDKIEFTYDKEEVYTQIFTTEDAYHRIVGDPSGGDLSHIIDLVNDAPYGGGRINHIPYYYLVFGNHSQFEDPGKEEEDPWNHKPDTLEDILLRSTYWYYHASYAVNEQLLLKKISFNGGSIQFDYSDRSDIEHRIDGTGSSAKKVARMKVLEKNNVMVKSIDFEHSYSGPSMNKNYKSTRLMLDGLKIKGRETDAPEKYKFTYDSGLLPEKNSDNTDYWGYYTDRKMVNPVSDENFRSFKIAPASYFHYTFNGFEKKGVIGGRTKTSNNERSQYGILKSITYPTGGKTTFDYELHRYDPNVNVINETSTPSSFKQIFYVSDALSNGSLHGHASEDSETSTTFTIDEDKAATINIDYVSRTGMPQHLNSIDAVSIRLTKTGGNFAWRYTLFDKSDDFLNIRNLGSNIYELDKQFAVTLPAGTYRFEVIPKESNVAGYELRGTVTFNDITTSSLSEGAGLRIKTITDMSENNAILSARTFKYTKEDRSSSSGLLMSWPTLNMYVSVMTSFYPFDSIDPYASMSFIYLHGSTSSFVPITTSASGSFVGYSRVEEHRIGSENAGYVTYTFENVPDSISIAYSEMMRYFPTIPSYKNGMTKSIGYHDSAGKLIKKQVFNNVSKRYSSIDGLVIYRTPPLLDTENMTGRYLLKYYRRYAEKLYVESSSETNYYPDGEIHSFTEYGYNANLLKNYEKTTVGDDVYETHILYPTDLATGNTVFSGMVDKKMVGIPVQVTNKKNSKIISGNKTTFGSVNGTYMPQNYSVLTNDSQTYINQLTINKHDAQGNILQYSNKANVPTTYLWSYNGLYLVAEIKNATYSEVNKALGSAFISRISSATTPSLSDINTLRNLRNMLPCVSVTVYTHSPLVGVTAITDPYGRTTKYEYDSFGRLSKIRDDQGTYGNLLQDFTYTMGHQTTQNNISTRTYTSAADASFVKDIEYYDGLGYPVQKIEVGASPQSGKSIVTPVYYDALRRETRQYLPYAVYGSEAFRSSAINEQVGFYNAKFAADAAIAYTENIYEASPLNRVVATYGAGNAFRANDKKTTFIYGANKADEVALFKIDAAGSLSRSGNYAANTLYKSTTTNEDGATTITFVDMMERVVLERMATDGTENNFDTYYVYDDRGNLCYVLPPKLSAMKTLPGAVLADSNADMAALAYVYKYDGRNRPIEKRLPGAALVYMVYDAGDRLVMTQDGNQRLKSQWIYSKFDNLDRLMSQSVVAHTGTLAASTLRTHFNSPGATLPTTLSTVAVLVENSYGE